MSTILWSRIFNTGDRIRNRTGEAGGMRAMILKGREMVLEVMSRERLQGWRGGRAAWRRWDNPSSWDSSKSTIKFTQWFLCLRKRSNQKVFWRWRTIRCSRKSSRCLSKFSWCRGRFRWGRRGMVVVRSDHTRALERTPNNYHIENPPNTMINSNNTNASKRQKNLRKFRKKVRIMKTITKKMIWWNSIWKVNNRIFKSRIKKNNRRLRRLSGVSQPRTKAKVGIECRLINVRRRRGKTSAPKKNDVWPAILKKMMMDRFWWRSPPPTSACKPAARKNKVISVGW